MSAPIKSVVDSKELAEITLLPYPEDREKALWIEIGKYQERYAALEAQGAALPANWLEDSSLRTWFPFTAEELARLKAQVQRMQEALEFYGDHENYPLPILEITHFRIVRDGGTKARAALAHHGESTTAAEEKA